MLQFVQVGITTLALMLTVSCGENRELGFSAGATKSTRAEKEGVGVGDDQINIDSSGIGDSNGGLGDNDSDAWSKGVQGEGADNVNIPGSVKNGTGGGGNGFLDAIGDVVGGLLPDPTIARCSSQCTEANNQLSMYNNLIGGYITKRWRNLAPGKLVCLDKNTCNPFDGCKSGKLYSYDPANGCRRSGSPVGVRGNDGCFDPNAKIKMADGSLKAIKLVRSGDKVYNPVTKKVMTVATMIKGPEHNPLFKVEHKNGSTLVTSKHPFILKSGRVVAAKNLKAGDEVQDANGQWQTLSLVERQSLKKDQQVWNFTFATKSQDPRDHMVVADGVAAGDLWLQRDLAKSNLAKK